MNEKAPAAGNCHPTSEVLSLYFDREGAAEMLRDVEEHLLSCAECRARLAELNTLSYEIRALPDLRAPDTLLPRVKEAIRPRAITPWLGRIAALVLLSVLTYAIWWAESPAPRHEELARSGDTRGAEVRQPGASHAPATEKPEGTPREHEQELAANDVTEKSTTVAPESAAVAAPTSPTLEVQDSDTGKKKEVAAHDSFEAHKRESKTALEFGDERARSKDQLAAGIEAVSPIPITIRQISRDGVELDEDLDHDARADSGNVFYMVLPEPTHGGGAPQSEAAPDPVGLLKAGLYAWAARGGTDESTLAPDNEDSLLALGESASSAKKDQGSLAETERSRTDAESRRQKQRGAKLGARRESEAVETTPPAGGRTRETVEIEVPAEHVDVLIEFLREWQSSAWTESPASARDDTLALDAAGEDTPEQPISKSKAPRGRAAGEAAGEAAGAAAGGDLSRDEKAITADEQVEPGLVARPATEPTASEAAKTPVGAAAALVRVRLIVTIVPAPDEE